MLIWGSILFAIGFVVWLRYVVSEVRLRRRMMKEDEEMKRLTQVKMAHEQSAWNLYFEGYRWWWQRFKAYRHNKREEKRYLKEMRWWIPGEPLPEKPSHLSQQQANLLVARKLKR